MKYPNRKWGLYSPNKWAGKTTFIEASMRTPAIIADYDDRFPVQQDGIILLSRKVIMNPLDLIETVERLIGEKEYKTIVVDTVTKLYQRYSRQAAMQIAQNRVKNKASTMVDKSNAMAIISTLSGYAPDIYYVWHQRPGGIDAKGQEVDRHKISDIELHTLHESVNVDLLFVREGNRYGVTVENARDIGSVRVNRGFTVWDEPDNFWQGFADKLERLIYTSFKNPQEALRWGAQQVGNSDTAEIQDFYNQVKADAGAKSASEMWVAWVQAIDTHVAKKQAEKPVTVTPPASTPKTSSPVVDDGPPTPPAADPLPIADRMPVVHDFEELESASQSRQTAVPEPTVPESVTETQPVSDAASAEPGGDQELFYEGGTAVAAEDAVDLRIFEKKFNRLPFDANQLHNSKKVNVAKGTWQ